MSDIGAGITYIPIHFAQDSYVLIAVEERVFIFTVHARAAGATVRGFVRLKAGIGKDDDQALRVLVGGGDWRVLFRHKLG